MVTYQEPRVDVNVWSSMLRACVAALVAAGCELAPVASVEVQTPGVPAGVSAGLLGQARHAWAGQGIASYRLTISYFCECPTGVYELTIVDGELAKVVSGHKTVDPARVEGFPTTVEAMFVQAEAALRRGGSIEATYDPLTGVPLKMFLDPIPNAIDDELSIEVSAFVPS
jgi:hypothetical protein